MQLDRRHIAALGLKAGTLSGIVLAFLLSGTYVKVQIEVDTRDHAQAQAHPSVPAAPTLRFE